MRGERVRGRVKGESDMLSPGREDEATRLAPQTRLSLN